MSSTLSINSLDAVTSAGEDDIVYLLIECLDPVHNDLSVVDVFGDEARTVAYRQHGILQQGMILDKLKCLVRQVERAANILLSHLVVDTLVKEMKLIMIMCVHCLYIHLYQSILWPTTQSVNGTHSSRAWRRGDTVMPDPLGVGLLHSGLLHVFAFGEDLIHSCYVVSTNC